MNYHYLSDLQVLTIIWFACIAGMIACAVFVFLFNYLVSVFTGKSNESK